MHQRHLHHRRDRRRHLRRLTAGLCWATLAGLLLAPLPARARERLAVLVVTEEAPELADDLTELVIATLAERRDRELVGMRELRGRLGDILPEEGLGACIDNPGCLARLGAAAGAAEAVIVKVSPQDNGYLLDLALTDTRNAQTEAHATAAATEIAELVTALRVGVGKLFAPRSLDARPPPAVASDPALAVAMPFPVANAAASPRSRPWLPYAGAGALGLAAVSFSAAAITGTIAMEEPTGSTRAIAQADLERRGGYATIANGLLVVGVVLTAAAGAAFVEWWRGPRGP
jgi:hypothetical protein